VVSVDSTDVGAVVRVVVSDGALVVSVDSTDVGAVVGVLATVDGSLASVVTMVLLDVEAASTLAGSAGSLAIASGGTLGSFSFSLPDIASWSIMLAAS
jgi:hypothetical protein